MDETILFADLAGFTALTEAHGDEPAVAVATRFTQLTDSLLGARAVLVKTIGDAVMLAGTDPGPVLDLALELQDAVRNEPRFPGVRVGLHAGPVVVRHGDRFGGTVNLAARIAAHARSGQVLGTQGIRDAADRPGLSAVAIGCVQLHGIAERVELFAFSPAGGDWVDEEIDPVCNMSVHADTAPATLPYAGRPWHFCSFECASRFAADPDHWVPSSPPS